jgi:hypothetical protein
MTAFRVVSVSGVRTCFWVAQRRGPQTARFSRAGVERFSAAIQATLPLTALAAEVTIAGRGAFRP